MSIKSISPELRKYYQSPKWLAISSETKLRDNNQCSICGSNKNLQVHHIRYGNLFREEKHGEDLMTVCNACHRIITIYFKVADALKEKYRERRRLGYS